MSVYTTRKYVLRTPFDGYPKRDDFEIVEENLPALQDGEVLIEAQWISVDPYLRSSAFAIRDVGKPVLLAGQIGKVIETKNKDYAVGDLLLGNFGWVSRTVCKAEDLSASRKLDPTLPVSPSTALGILGMPGATAYFGVLDVIKPKEGETLVVDAAAGAVGSAVGQIAKMKGMRVVGFTGSDKKVEYLKSIGYDAAYNYKTVSSLSDALAESCPNGVDAFFDNVGGEFLDAVLDKMNKGGRALLCGYISQYNNTSSTSSATPLSAPIIAKQLTLQGFMVFEYLPRWGEAFQEMAQWISEGKLKYNETTFEGFEQIFDAFVALFDGKNIGKIVVKI